MTQTAPLPAATPPGGKPRVDRRLDPVTLRIDAPEPAICGVADHPRTAPSPWAMAASPSRWFAALRWAAFGIVTRLAGRHVAAIDDEFVRVGAAGDPDAECDPLREAAVGGVGKVTPPVRPPLTASNWVTLPPNVDGPSARDVRLPACSVTSCGIPIAGPLVLGPASGDRPG